MRSALVTGAGSGVGRAVAEALAAAGFQVGLVGRNEKTLRETIVAAVAHGAKMIALPADVSNPLQVQALFESLQEHGVLSLDVLVNCAGTNTAQRDLEHLTVEAYQNIINVNLNGAFYCVRAALPLMRAHGGGTIVNIVSDAGLKANAKAGAAYVASKFGLTGLTESINAEERENNIRACAIFPGDINTGLLDKRPSPPPVAARQTMLQPEDIAACVMLAINLPARAVVEKLVVRPR